jgi:hypothetical protein
MRANCPHCLSYRLRPDPYRWYERLFMLLYLHPFRCLRCGARFLRFSGLPHISRLLAMH